MQPRVHCQMQAAMRIQCRSCPTRAAPLPDAADCGGLSIGDVVLRGRHTLWFEEHVPRRRRADLRSRIPWLGKCRLREPSHPLQLVGVDLFLFTDLKTLEIREICPVLQGGFLDPLAQCLCTTDPSRYTKRRCGAIERFRECGVKGTVAPGLPVDVVPEGHPATRMERTPAMDDMAVTPAVSWAAEIDAFMGWPWQARSAKAQPRVREEEARPSRARRRWLALQGSTRCPTVPRSRASQTSRRRGWCCGDRI